jgi:hypothetical protein
VYSFDEERNSKFQIAKQDIPELHPALDGLNKSGLIVLENKMWILFVVY